jgi:RNA polymerase sigma-70 factor (sigma-E family)
VKGEKERGMRRDGHAEELERFLAERGEPLLRAAVLLAGGRDAGEDLLQSALERMLRHWRRIDGDPEGYLRRTLHNLATDGWRRQRTRHKLLRRLERAAEPATGDAIAGVDLRDALVRLLAQLPARQRSVIVLRYWEQLSEAETARVLGCSAGTVKSAASRGLARLRALTESWPSVDATTNGDAKPGTVMPGAGVERGEHE